MRVSVTDFEQWRRWQDDEEMTLEELLGRLQRREPATVEMEAGTAFHALLEGKELPQPVLRDLGAGKRRKVSQAFISSGFAFHFPEEIAVQLCPYREIKGEQDYFLGQGARVTLSGKVDGLDGFRVDDHKLTFSGFDAAQYMESYQWRSYLSIFSARMFVYNVFEAYLSTVEWSDGLRDVTVKAVHSLPLWRYPELEIDLERRLTGFWSFAQTYLPGGSIRSGGKAVETVAEKI